ncbi:hypothetical protein T552_02535 [Pneumocystis carinii B80]|uniref:60S acidic ribosomal protein P1 n=1 Tax=Pneumocystis carinii (strain B80) TaxID=1408658 RepID=A0A0W4ZF84_PNEC8|nr:hypothetical protein T552_02535 [Pneumocystis carinii B80]KTW27043.1 hypothetical protein T552_02535 [Pneumocystis carinii B80]
MSIELAVSYATLILADDGVEITSDKLQTLVRSAGIKVENIWTSLFAKALEGKNIKELLLNINTGEPTSTTGVPPPQTNETVTNEAPKEEEKEESDEDMGFGLFD